MLVDIEKLQQNVLFYSCTPLRLWKKAHYAEASKWNVDTAKMSAPEIITLSICGELIGMDSENAWYSFVKRNYRHLFPRLCCRTRFNRTRRALSQVMDRLCTRLQNKVLGHNLCMAFNSIFQSSCDIGKIKQLIFWRFALSEFGRDFLGFFSLLLNHAVFNYN